jgi:Malate synthase
MKVQYKKINKLSVSIELFNFINKELLPGTKIKKEIFWNGFDKFLHDLTPKK